MLIPIKLTLALSAGATICSKLERPMAAKVFREIIRAGETPPGKLAATVSANFRLPPSKETLVIPLDTSDNKLVIFLLTVFSITPTSLLSKNPFSTLPNPTLENPTFSKAPPPALIPAIPILANGIAVKAKSTMSVPISKFVIPSRRISAAFTMPYSCGLFFSNNAPSIKAFIPSITAILPSLII